MTDGRTTPRFPPSPQSVVRHSPVVDEGQGCPSCAAQNWESVRLANATELLDQAARVLRERRWTAGELHLLAVQLTETLRDVHRIAESRGSPPRALCVRPGEAAPRGEGSGSGPLLADACG
ncbi:hypothetical protein HUT18_06515 [Streptomyces sp. NA04227]|uniref:hypothetical protein n=1 Tax=Streptomyces sp. NA04227 TaxID=2742136 RepID=UPI0015910FED|nr:hypothetical protein [Streptomyces sp. NA04227]QKW06107.1 hypothetical protein HUT18_06515 [Streptomyces sp. NA04227]